MKRGLAAFCIIAFSALSPPLHAKSRAQSKRKLPKPVQMDRGVQFARDPKTGNLNLKSAAEVDRSASHAPLLRVHVNLVEVECNIFAADGSAVRDLSQNNFRVFEDGVPQTISHFDAFAESAAIALVMDASPSVLPDSASMKSAAEQLIRGLSSADEVAVADFSEHTFLLLPFSRDRQLLTRAVSGVNVRNLFSDTGGSNIYRSLYLVAEELFTGRTGRKAIILLTDGQDSGMGLTLDGSGVRPGTAHPQNRATFEDIVRALSERGIEIYVISTQNRPRIMTPHWLALHRSDSLITPAVLPLGIPAYTAFLAELVRRVGGQLYFLNESGSVAAAYHSIVQRLSAQYTLGYYPRAGDTPGWHSLRVELLGRDGLRVVSRSSYYQAAEK